MYDMTDREWASLHFHFWSPWPLRKDKENGLLLHIVHTEQTLTPQFGHLVSMKSPLHPCSNVPKNRSTLLQLHWLEHTVLLYSRPFTIMPLIHTPAHQEQLKVQWVAQGRFHRRTWAARYRNHREISVRAACSTAYTIRFSLEFTSDFTTR